jgi:hypothetical protein
VSKEEQTKDDGPTPPTLSGPTPPSLEDPQAIPDASPSEVSEVKESIPKKKDKTKVTKKLPALNRHEIIRQWKVIHKRTVRSLETLMSIEFREKAYLTPINIMYRQHIHEMFMGQISYLQEMIQTIQRGDDELSQVLMEKDFDRRASTQVFETLVEIISEEIDRFLKEKPIIIDFIENDLKRLKDARLEPRACFWILWSTGLQLCELHRKTEKSFNIVLEVILRYPPIYKRVLGVFLHFALNLAKNMQPFQIDSSRTTLTIGPGGTGYNMAPWIKYRYGTNSQSYIEYERYLMYYSRSFGKIPGNSPSFENSPKDGYRKWIMRTLDSLEKSMRKSSIIVNNARGNTLEGMLAGMINELEEELEKRETIIDPIDPSSLKLINQPIGGEGALKFLEWLFETALQRYQTTNISIHGKKRLSLDMFQFIIPTIRWENEFGERLVHDWLDPEN